MWYVEIVESSSQEVVVRSVPCISKRKAKKIEDGLSIVVDWDNFETRIVFDGEK